MRGMVSLTDRKNNNNRAGGPPEAVMRQDRARQSLPWRFRLHAQSHPGTGWTPACTVGSLARRQRSGDPTAGGSEFRWRSVRTSAHAEEGTDRTGERKEDVDRL